MLLSFTFGAGAKKALLVGIGGYPESSGWASISGARDVDLLAPRLESAGFQLTTLVDGEATKRGVTEALSQLAAEAAPGDTLYIQFSGHGQLVEDVNGDEPEGVDQSFVCFDACFQPTDGYYGQNHLIDDEIYTYISAMRERVGESGFVALVFDSCYSGGAERGDMADAQSSESPVEFVEQTRGASDEFMLNPEVEAYLADIPAPQEYAQGGGTLQVISACEPDRKNYECRDRESGVCYGSLSYCIAMMLDNHLPLDSWGKFFDSREFRSYNIFRSTQKPQTARY